MRAYRFILCIILLGGLIARFWAIDFGLPIRFYWPRPDEELLVDKAFRFGYGDLNPHFFHYPSLIMYLLFALDIIYFFLGYLVGWFKSVDDYLTLYHTDPSSFFLTARLLSATLGVSTILVVYKIGERVYTPTMGIIAATFLAFTFLHVRDSHFGVTDVSLTFFITLAYLFIVQIYAVGDKRSYFLAGLFCGLATSTKYNAFLLVIPLILAHFLREEKLKDFRYPLLSLNCLIIFFLLGSPFVLLDSYNFLKDFLYEVEHLKQGHGLDLGIGWIYHLQFSLRYGMGIMLEVICLLGVCYALLRHKRRDLVLLSFPLAYYYFIGNGKTVFLRYMMPLLPLLCFFGARFLKDIVDMLADRFSLGQMSKGLIVATAILLILLEPIHSIFHYNRIISQKDTRELARKWIRKNVPKGEKIFVKYCGYSSLKLEGYDIQELAKLREAVSDFFSVRWQGNFSIEKPAEYTFYVKVDDGVRLWIDGELAIDQWKIQPPTEYSHRIFLARGSHEIKLEYFENQGGALIQLSWVPSYSHRKAVFTPLGGLRGEYYSDSELKELVFSRKDKAIDFNWGKGTPLSHYPGKVKGYIVVMGDSKANILRNYCPVEPDVENWVEANAVLLMRFNPYNNERKFFTRRPLYDEIDAYYVPVANFSAIERPGPIIKIYKLKGSSE